MRILFSKLSLFTFLYLLSSCNKEISECKNIKYDGKHTTLDDKKFTGICKTVYKNEAVRSIRQYYKGLDHGEWKFFFENGQLQTLGTFNKGVRVGQWEYFYKNGAKWKLQSYNNKGEKSGRWQTYDLNGLLLKEDIYLETP